MEQVPFEGVFRVPSPRDGVSVPIAVTSARLGQDEEGNDVVSVNFFRPALVPLQSFSVRVRLSTSPLSDPDPAHPYYELNVSEGIGAKDLPDLIFVPPTGVLTNGATVFISEVVFFNGMRRRYAPSDFEGGIAEKEENAAKGKVYLLRDTPIGRKIYLPTVPEYDLRIEEEYWPDTPGKDAGESRSGEGESPAGEEKPAPEENAGKNEKRKKKDKGENRRKKKGRRTAALILIALLIAAEAIGFAFLYRNLTLSYSVDALIREERFAEAFKIAEAFESEDLKNSVCRAAEDRYEKAGDYENAYVYASLSSERLKEKLGKYASEHLRKSDGTIDGAALRAALASADGESREKILSALVSEYCKAGTLVFGEELTPAEVEILSHESVFSEVVTAYVESREYDGIVSLAEKLQKGGGKLSREKTLEIVRTACAQKGDAASRVILESRLNGSPEEVGVSPSDPSILADLETVYPLLSREQKRSLWAKTLTACGEVVELSNGRIAGRSEEGLVSIACGENIAIALDGSGRATILEDGHRLAPDIGERDDTVAIAAGSSHVLLLRGDGTVSAFGDNSKGQCDVASWSGIVSIAAGGSFSVGLKSDGTLVACGSNHCGQCEVDAYHNVVSIACGDETLAILFRDGNVRVQGYHGNGLADVNSQTGIAQVRAGGTGVMLLKKNGELLLFTGSESGSYGNVSSLAGQRIADFAVGSFLSAVKTAEGAVYLSGANAPLE